MNKTEQKPKQNYVFYNNYSSDDVALSENKLKKKFSLELSGKKSLTLTDER